MVGCLADVAGRGAGCGGGGGGSVPDRVGVFLVVLGVGLLGVVGLGGPCVVLWVGVCFGPVVVH